MKVLQFYTSTGQRDAERMNSGHGLLCPNWRVLPFQIQRATAGATGFTSALLVDCAGNTTNILSDLEVDVNQRTNYDFLTYNGLAFDTEVDYGVYYMQLTDSITTWYSEWLDIRNIQPNLLTGWTATGYDTFVVSTGGSRVGVDVIEATNTGGAASALSNSFSVRRGELLYLTTEYNETSGTPDVKMSIVDSGGSVISIIKELTDGEVESNNFIAQKTDSAAQLKILNDDPAGNFTLGRLSLRRWQGDGSYCYMRFGNTKDLQGASSKLYELTPERESIMYASGFEQQIYLNTRLNNPTHEIVEVGEEKNGVFELEKQIDKYIYNVITYEPKAVFNALRLLPMHDNIQIIDEVGNRYRPDQGNVRVGWEQTTYDTGTLKIEFNEDNYVWTHSMSNIT